MENFMPSDPSCHGFTLCATRGMYNALRDWERRNGIVRDSKSFGRDGFKTAMAEKKAKQVKTAEEIRERNRSAKAKYRAANPERVRELDRLAQLRHRDKRNARRRENYTKMSAEKRQQKREYDRQRYKHKKHELENALQSNSGLRPVSGMDSHG